MTNKELTSVAIKVFAIYVLVKAILSVPIIASTATVHLLTKKQAAVDILLWSIGAATFVVLILIASGLWKLATNTAHPVNQGEVDQTEHNVDASFLISLLGLYVVINGLTRLGYSGVDAFWRSQHDDISMQSIGYIVVAAIQVLIGISLILQKRGWLSLLERLRTAGLDS